MSLDKRIVIALKCATIGLFVVSLFLPVLPGLSGIEALGLGFMAIFMVPGIIGFLTWMANFFLFFSFMVKKNRQRSIGAAGIAIALGVLGNFIDEIYVTEGGDKESVELAIGYTFWMWSMISNLALQVFQFKKKEIIDYLINFRKEYL